MKKILSTILLLLGIIILCNNTYATENIEVMNDDEILITNNETNGKKELTEDLKNPISNIEEQQKYSNYTYYIKNYDVAIEVTEDNVLNITETIDVYFNKSSHGIFRGITTRGTFLRNDSSSSKYRAKVSNISVNDTYQVSNQGDNKNIRIGSANKYVNGDKTYIIKYSYAFTGDTSKNFDELYYNIIGADWECPIDKVIFSIKMPKDFDFEKIGFTHGKLDSRETNGIVYEIDGNTIVGEFMNSLEPREALTVRIELPEGYFNTSKLRMILLTILIVISNVIEFFATHIKLTICLCYLLAILVVFIKWIVWKNNNQIIETVEFYPPEDLNSLDVGYIFKGKAISNDITSLIIYLANKGYIKIEDDKNDFKIIKLKEYDGNNKYEKKVYDGLFKKKDEVTKKDLTKSFYKITASIEYELNKKDNREKIIIPRTKIQRRLAMIPPIFIVLVLLFTIVYGNGYEREAYVLLPFGVVTCIVLAIGINARVTKRKGIIISTAANKGSEIKTKIDFTGKFWMRMAMVLLFLDLMLYIIFLFTRELYLDTSYYIYVLFGFLALILTLFFTFNIENRTEYGNRMLGKILGFKRFLENAREDELQDLVDKYPTYFYDILPYTYVLGISDKWISKFETINMPSPEWYKSEREDSFGFESVTKVLDKTINSANFSRPPVSHSSSSSSSSSSSFSSSESRSSSERIENRSTGGGSAGRGAGGGGGGAW